MRFWLAPRSMTLDDLELQVWIFRKFRWILQISDATTAKRLKIDQYCQRQRCTCKHVELEQFLACFCVARVCQWQLGFLVLNVMCCINPRFTYSLCAYWRRRLRLNGHFHAFQTSVTLTLDHVMRHTVVYHSSTFTYMLNCIHIGKKILWANGQTYGRLY